MQIVTLSTCVFSRILFRLSDFPTSHSPFNKDSFVDIYHVDNRGGDQQRTSSAAANYNLQHKENTTSQFIVSSFIII